MLNTNCEALREEILLVIRAFDSENEDFTHYFSSSGDKFLNVIEYDGKFYDFEEEYKAENELIFKRLAKRACKLSFYKVLSEVKGYGLPWGALTGIRPTKLAYNEITSGGDYKKLFEKFCVSQEYRIFSVRRKMYIIRVDRTYMSVYRFALLNATIVLLLPRL